MDPMTYMRVYAFIRAYLHLKSLALEMTDEDGELLERLLVDMKKVGD